MRILVTCDPLIPVPPRGYGGIERIVDGLTRELRSRGHVVGLVAKAGSSCEVDYRIAWPGEAIHGVGSTTQNGLTLRKAVASFRPDVVHSFSRLAYLLPIFFPPWRRLPKLMSYQRPPSIRPIRLASRIAGESLTFSGCSEYICGIGRQSGGQWTTVHNFIDPAKFNFSAHIGSDAPLLFLSRVESIKGADLAIAIARRAGRRLIIAGNRASAGSEKLFFETRVAPHLGSDGIEWIGEVDDVQKRQLLSEAAALLVPVQWEEPFGIVFVEALAAGTPVLTCARGALPEIVRAGVTGFFITDIEDGVDAVKRLGSLDRRACRDAAVSRFNVAICTDKYLAAYAAQKARRA